MSLCSIHGFKLLLLVEAEDVYCALYRCPASPGGHLWAYDDDFYEWREVTTVDGRAGTESYVAPTEARQ